MTKVEMIAQQVTDFYCQSVGRRLDSNKEFSLLSDWSEAIAQALKSATQPWEKVQLRAMRDECSAYLECWGAEG